jgi:preprotein translocase SecE subunit
MAVAVKNSPVKGSNPFETLAAASLGGLVYVVASFAVVFGALPAIWHDVLNFNSGSLAAASVLGVLMVLAAVALIIVGGVLLGRNARVGVRAGVFVSLVGFLLIVGLTRWVSVWTEHFVFDTGSMSPPVGLGITIAFAVAFLVLGVRLLYLKQTEAFLAAFEEQGWFSANAYKKLQGQRVRRATILGILVIAGARVFTLLRHETLMRGPENLEVVVPYTGKMVVTDRGDAAPAFEALEQSGAAKPTANGGLVVSRLDYAAANATIDPASHVKIKLRHNSDFAEGQIVTRSDYDKESRTLKEREEVPADVTAPTTASGALQYQKLTLLPMLPFTVPFLIIAGSLWLAWRVVNYPAFADFLIMTEAEMNKVSWSTRKRLMQDTVVVLITVALMAGFLFGTDQLWRVLLSSPPIKVLQFPEQKSDQNERERPLW